MDLRAHWLSLLGGVMVQPLQMIREDETVEACLRDFGTTIDLEEFMTGRARTCRRVLLYHGSHLEDRPALYELSPLLEEHLKRVRKCSNRAMVTGGVLGEQASYGGLTIAILGESRDVYRIQLIDGPEVFSCTCAGYTPTGIRERALELAYGYLLKQDGAAPRPDGRIAWKQIRINTAAAGAGG